MGAQGQPQKIGALIGGLRMERDFELPEVPDGRSAERRRYRRFSVMWGGQVIGGVATSCVVLDISAQGAKLRVPNGTLLPSRFTLLMTGRGSFDAQLVDLTGPIARARLLSEPDEVADAVSDIVPPPRFLEEHRSGSVALH